MIRTNYEARSTVDATEPYYCEACGHAARAQIEMTGQSSRSSRALNHDAGAAQAAQANAYMEASVGATLAIELAPCPKCGERSPSALARHRNKYAVRGWIVLVVVALVIGTLAAAGIVYAWGEDGLLLAPLGLVPGVLVGLLIAKTGHWHNGRLMMEASDAVCFVNETAD